tara:strand:+ start:634 stop:801 length:168 start_codon:yes stop_codon:yes gene_type:complete
MSKLTVCSTQELPPEVCKELTNIILDSFNKQLNNYFDKQLTPNKKKKRRKRNGKK